MLQDTLSSLKSRYQAASESKLVQLVSASFAMLAPESASLGLPDFPADNLEKAAQLLVKNLKFTLLNVWCKINGAISVFSCFSTEI